MRETTSFKVIWRSPSQAVSRLAASASADEAEDNEEDVDDVQVELQGSKDVFLRAELVAAFLSTDDHLSVKDEELKHERRTLRQAVR